MKPLCARCVLVFYVSLRNVPLVRICSASLALKTGFKIKKLALIVDRNIKGRR